MEWLAEPISGSKDKLRFWMKTKLRSKPGMPVSRAAQVHPFINFLDDIGAPTDAGLERSKLPPGLREFPEMPVSVRAIYEFVAVMARREGVEDIGWRAPQLAQLSPRLLQALERSPTLLEALEALCRYASLESSGVEVWLEPQGDTLLCCHRISIKREDIGSSEAYLLQSKLMISFVQGFVGSDYMPPEIGIAGDGQVGSFVREALGDTRIHRTSDYGWLRLPRSVLCRPRQSTTPVGTQVRTEGEFEPAHDLVGSLKQLVRPYIRHGPPNIQLAAHLGDMSVRTLQRRLAHASSSYREVVQHLKFEAARELLNQPDVKILDIALETGFTNSPHFTRFFRRIAGVSPSEYRTAIF
jgi:AraC-like DNA-binding protein